MHAREGSPQPRRHAPILPRPRRHVPAKVGISRHVSATHYALGRLKSPTTSTLQLCPLLPAAVALRRISTCACARAVIVAGGQIATAEGKTLWLTGIGIENGSGITFDYYDDGNLDSSSESWGNGNVGFNVSYDPFVISYYCYDDSYQLYDFKFNKDGYITSVADSRAGRTATFTYNSDGHLTKAMLEYKSNALFEDEFTWDGDLLTQYSSSISGSGEDDGQQVATFEYTTAYPNTTWQWTPIMLPSGWYDQAIWESLYYLGYLGKGPSYHPTTVTEDTYSSSYVYSPNSNGAIYRYKSTGAKKYTYFTYADYSNSDEGE